jgi:hypothetical protein
MGSRSRRRLRSLKVEKWMSFGRENYLPGIF